MASMKTANAQDDGTLAAMMSGAVAGAVGVWALDRIDWFMWNRESEATRAQTVVARPGGEAPAQALVSKLEHAAGRNLTSHRHELASQAVHYSIGIAPAIGYALFRDKLPGRGVMRGAAFGAALFVSQDEVLNTVTGLGGKPNEYPRTAHARGVVAHVVYGIATELTLNLFQALRTRS
jgi:uncharacterized membrane protein YagU involved in acid resistance